MLSSVKLSNEIVSIEPVSLKYLDDFHEYSVDKELYRYLEFGPFKSIDETELYLKKLIARSESDNAQYWFIKLNAEDKVVGSVGLHDLNMQRGSVEIGYGLSPAYWGKGIFLSAANLICDYVFNEMKLHRMVARTDVGNLPSIKGLKKLKFKEEGIMRDYYLFNDGTRHDAVLMARLSTD